MAGTYYAPKTVLSNNETLQAVLLPEPHNPVDRHAILVFAMVPALKFQGRPADCHKVGYVPAILAHRWPWDDIDGKHCQKLGSVFFRNGLVVQLALRPGCRLHQGIARGAAASQWFNY